MNENEYLSKLESIRGKIERGLIEGLDENLEELYNIKPVRLKWFVTKAELMIKQNIDITEIYRLLDSKGWQLYNYDGIKEYNSLYIELAKKNNYNFDINRCKWIYEKLNENNKFNILNGLNSELEVSRERFISQMISKRNVIDLGLIYYQINNYLMYEILANYCLKNNYIERSEQFIHDIPNMGYINSIIEGDDKNCFIIVANNREDYSDCIVLVKILVDIGKKVYLIDLPMLVEVENKIDVASTLEISIENSEKYFGATAIHPFDIIYQGKSIGDNREYIIDHIANNYADGNLATILCSGIMIDDLCKRPLLKKQMERLSPFQADYYESNMSFGWVGKYTSYISHIYDFEVEEEIQKYSECEFSIVIPARNSAATLRHTLKTCLNQRYQGAYEIVLSDNSTRGNTEVYDLYCELNDSKIKYYKTPRDLHLPKSFEFAFLKAKGEFIISIGSDDALLPWTLELLAEVIESHPNEEIFQWERGFYAWPGFNGGQENELLIPSKYKKDEYEVIKVDKNEYLAKILNNPKAMYGLPMLYVNSGFKRSYLQTLINRSGRLWDGICQDLYIGVVNISINDYIINIKYPLTIAGMTSSSVGAQSNIGASTVKESNNRVEEAVKTNNIGGFSTSAIERLMPEVTTDVSSLYNSILRVIARGLFPIEYLDNLLNFKQMFKESFDQIDVTDVLYDKKLHYFRYTASKHGDEFLRWFDENIYKQGILPRKINSTKIEEDLNRKKYKEGPTKTGGEIVDASRFGVTNVYEASLLFEKLTGL